MKYSHLLGMKILQKKAVALYPLLFELIALNRCIDFPWCALL